MKNFLFLFLSFLISTGFTQQYGEPNYVYWKSPEGLKWDLFKGHPNHGIDHHAYSMLGLSYEVKSNTASEVTFYISAYFDTAQSWVKKDQRTESLLQHEQKHFDICEIHRRMFVKELTDVPYFTYANVNDRIRNIFNDVNTKVDLMQIEYDRDTNHSKIRTQQKVWDEKVSNLLKEYDAYKETEVTIALKK